MPRLSESACSTPGPLRSRLFQAFPCYYEPLRLPLLAAASVISSPSALRLYPSPEWVSQVPGCSFGTRCPALPRIVRWLVSVTFPPTDAGFTSSELLGHSHLWFRGFRCRFACAAARTFAGPRLQSAGYPAPCSVCFMCDDSYMANSFQSARARQAFLAHQKALNRELYSLEPPSEPHRSPG